MKFSAEIRGGLEAALQSVSINAIPALLFVASFGTLGLLPGLWAVLVTVALVPLLRFFFSGHCSILVAPRSATSATYIALVAELTSAAAGAPTALQPGSVTLQHFSIGLAAGSLLFLAASFVVLLAGFLKLGHIFKMIPTPVTAGISNGTALVLTWLAIREAQHGSPIAWITAGAMVLVYTQWPRIQRAWPMLQAVPAIVVAIIVGAACTLTLEPAATVPIAPALGASVLNWLPWNLWLTVPANVMGHLLIIGLPGAAALAVVMILETFTTMGIMELRFGVRTDANKELIALGGCNMAVSLVGGIPSTGSIIPSVSNRTAGGSGKVSVLVCYGVTLAVLLALGAHLMALPHGLAVGLLIVQALVMLQPGFVSRVWALRRAPDQGRKRDLGLLITLTITLVVFLGNFVWACFLGVALSSLMVLRRVSVNLTARWAYLDRYRSRRVRSPGEAKTLARYPKRVAVLRLTGHLFFGNSTRLTQLADELDRASKAVVVDISEVYDADPSGCDAIVWLIKNLAERRLSVMVSGLNRSRATDLVIALQRASGVHFHIDMDRALEACEDLIIVDATLLTTPLMFRALAANALLQGLDSRETEAVMAVGMKRTVARGDKLFSKDSVAEGVWLLESGHVSILAGEAPHAPRISTFGPGQFLGEMGFIDGKARSATARADTPVTAMLLNGEAIAALTRNEPATVLKVTRNIAEELSHRVRDTSSRVEEEMSEPATGWANSTLEVISRF